MRRDEQDDRPNASELQPTDKRDQRTPRGPLGDRSSPGRVSYEGRDIRPDLLVEADDAAAELAELDGRKASVVGKVHVVAEA
jgi:hypothetical protein